MLKSLFLYGMVVFTSVAYCSIDPFLFERTSYMNQMKSEVYGMQGKVKSELLKVKAKVISKNSYEFIVRYNAIVADYKTKVECLVSKVEALKMEFLNVKASAVSPEEIALLENNILEIESYKKILQAILHDIPGYYI